MTKSLLDSLIQEILREAYEKGPRSWADAYQEDLRDTSLSSARLSQRYKVSTNTVNRDRRKLGIVTGLKGGAPKESRPPGYDEALRDTNRSQQSIADEFGLSRTAVLKDRRSLSIVTGLKGGASKEDRPPGYEEALRDTSRSSYDVANEFGFNPATVASDRREAGIVTGLIGGPPRKVRTAEYEAAIRDATRTTKSIHDEFGIPLEIITNDRRVLGIETGLKGGQPRRARPPGYEEALRDSSRSLQSVASEFGVSGPTVLRDRRALSIPTSKGVEGRQTISLPDSYEEDPAISSMSIEDDSEISDTTIVSDRESTGDTGRRRPRSMGYDEALRDTTRTYNSIADEFGLNVRTIIRDRKALDLGPKPRVGSKKSDRPPGYEEALRDTTRTLRDIGQEFDLSYTTVKNDRGDLGIETGRTSGFAVRDRPQEYEEALRDTSRIAQSIADEFGFSVETVRRDRKDAGITVQRGRRWYESAPEVPVKDVNRTVDPEKDPEMSIGNFQYVRYPIMKDPAIEDYELDYEDDPEEVDIWSMFSRRKL